MSAFQSKQFADPSNKFAASKTAARHEASGLPPFLSKAPPSLSESPSAPHNKAERAQSPHSPLMSSEIEDNALDDNSAKGAPPAQNVAAGGAPGTDNTATTQSQFAGLSVKGETGSSKMATLDNDDTYSLSTCGATEVFHSPSVLTIQTEREPPDALEVEGSKADQPSTARGVYWVFGLVFLLEIFVNFDSGVIPAILPTLEEEFNLVGTTEGLLGALPYIGLGFSSPFVGRGLTLFSPKYFCFFTMLVNVLATGLLAVCTQRWMLFFSRLLIGLSQAGFSIYAPVWVDRFAPPDKLTLWMGLTQGGVVIGTMLGCVTAGALDAARRAGATAAHWRYALAIQFVWLFVLVFVWGLTPRRLLEIQLSASASDDTDSLASSQSSDEAEPVVSGEEQTSEEEAAECQRPKVPSSRAETAQSQQDNVKKASVWRAKSAGSRGSLRALSQAPRVSADSTQEEGSDQKPSYQSDAGAIPYRERRTTRSGHRQSDLPEYLKDPLSNLLPLDFFASNAQSRRFSQARQPAGSQGSGRRLESHHGVAGADGVLRSHSHSLQHGREDRASAGGGLRAAQHEAMVIGKTQSWGEEVGAHRMPLQSVEHTWHEGLRQDSRGEGIANNTFQYQMTFLTPHPTTLAFEALNWASGTHDPMLLVQREARQTSAAGAGGPLRSAKPSAAPSSTPSEGPKDLQVVLDAQVYEEPSDSDLEKNKCVLPESTAVPTSDLRFVAQQSPAAKRAVRPKTFGVRESIRILLESPLYVCVTFALCALFFEVTAIQFWSISYFQQVMKQPMSTVLIAFNVTAATAPISGVLGGGWFIDFIGGYKDEKGMRTTLSVLLMWATACLFLGVAAGWTPHFWQMVFCMWWILFFGGCILPAATGIVIASVPVEVRAFGSGFCMMLFNVLGYVLGTFLPGILIETVSLLWGMRVIYLWSINGVLGFALACCFVWRLEIKPTFILADNEALWARQSPVEGSSEQAKLQQDSKEERLGSR